MNYRSENYLPQNMSSRPGFTSGRGATITDLDSDRLTFIYDKIVENENQDAADNFVLMVQNLQVASCTEFLLSLYRLEIRGWKYDDTFFSDSNSNGIYAENEGEAIGTLFAGISGGSRVDDTLRIVYPFLSKFDKLHITDDPYDNNRRNYRGDAYYY